MAERLIVVSNRLPFTAHRSGDRWTATPSSGGLVAALAPLMQRAKGLWIGWPGEASATDAEGWARVVKGLEKEHGLVAVELPRDLSRSFYEGYSNNTLWPLLHGFPSRVAFDQGTWRAYQDANRRFAEAVVAHYRPGDLVWVHDYQLMLLPELLRRELPEAGIGFFLHIPFPAAEIVRVLPDREALLRGLLGADFLAFQTHGHLNEFRRTLLQVLGLESQMDRIDVDGRTIRFDALPIGIVTTRWEQLVTSDPAVQREIRSLRARHAGRHLVLAVDRLDYTKGIPERLRAFHRLLQRGPHWRGKVTLIQVAVPSRERIARYAELRREVSELVGEINGELGSPDWSPVIYLRRSVSESTLAALYAAADVAWVSPLRDGMNLVAKEYVVCQKDGDGVLVISEFAGAAQEMGEAIRVNPYDLDGSADALERAFELPLAERHERQAALLARVQRNDAIAWQQRFVDGLREAATERAQATRVSPMPPFEAIRAAFWRRGRRIVYLDYDGTLVPIAPRPAMATPSDSARDLVAALARQRATTTVLLSGRPKADLEAWFGDVPGIWLVAEHGALLREPGTGDWRSLRAGADVEWKARVRPVLELFAMRLPGSSIEEKEYSMGWHYRLADPEFGTWMANDLASTLYEHLAGTELAVLHGSKVIEVRYAWANKGEAAAHIRALGPRPSFELAIGDDRTDEDLFERLSDRAWTIRVGPGATRARFHVPGPESVLGLLAVLVETPA